MSLRVRCCAIDASGRCQGRVQSWHLTVGTVIVGGSEAVERVRSVTTGASGHPEKDPVKGYNGSIRWDAYKYLLAGPWGGLL
jgi:hypothetical protein